MKPLILPKQVQTENKAGGGPCFIEMEPLKLRPVCDKLPTVRRGRPFRSSNTPGQKRAPIHKNEENDNIQGDTNIQIETSSYNEWFVKEDLASPPPKHKDNYLLTNKVEDITSEDSDGTSEKQGVGQVETSARNVENEVEEQTENVKTQKLDFLTQEVEDMISKGEGEAEIQKKVERLQMILKSLDEEKKDSKKSSGPEGGTDTVIHKLQTEKPEQAEKPDSVKNVIGKGSTVTPIKIKPGNVEINKDEVSGKGQEQVTLLRKS